MLSTFRGAAAGRKPGIWVMNTSNSYVVSTLELRREAASLSIVYHDADLGALFVLRLRLSLLKAAGLENG